MLLLKQMFYTIVIRTSRTCLSIGMLPVVVGALNGQTEVFHLFFIVAARLDNQTEVSVVTETLTNQIEDTGLPD
jgi:hypothetical protein